MGTLEITLSFSARDAIMVIILVAVAAVASLATGLLLVHPENYNGTLQVTLPDGIVQGVEMIAGNDFHFYAYRGIPYAGPPVGNFRFRPPQSSSSWSGILNATIDGPKCAQILDDTSSEDCLYINVYTSNIKRTDYSLEPVMVWIHGGAFVVGTSDYSLYGPDYLVQKGVVVVTFNYRLGVFGFLSTEDLSSPGNYGLKDQIAALKWVQKNIENFGGDPNNVTIFGQSAGGASVGYMLFAPKAKGLFHRAISESGSVLCPWAQQSNSQRIAYQIGILLGILPVDSAYLLKRLRRADSNDLLTIANSATILELISPLNGLAYSPTIEPEHEDAVFTKYSHELLRLGKFHRVPFVIGFNTEESTLAQEYASNNMIRWVGSNVMLNNVVPDDMNVHPINYLAVALSIKNFYFGHIINSIADKADILRYISDVQFTKPIKETVKQMSKYTPVYLYQFSYEGVAPMKGFNILNYKNTDKRIMKGVGHGEDLFFVFKNINLTLENDEDIQMKEIMTTLWTNFAKYGQPTPLRHSLFNNTIWNTSSKVNEFQYLDIQSQLKTGKNPKREEMEFWDELYRDYGQSPYNTY